MELIDSNAMRLLVRRYPQIPSSEGVISVLASDMIWSFVAGRHVFGRAPPHRNILILNN